jgi:hypothetical protein
MYRLIYLKLELKKAFTTFGHVMMGAITLIVLIGIIAFSSTKLLYNNETIQKITIAIVQQEEDDLVKMGLQMIESMESIDGISEFVLMNEKEAIEALKAQKIFAVLLFPTDLIQSIIYGKNTPVEVILPANMGIEAAVFKEITDAGAIMLGSTQAGIYAMGEYLEAYHLETSLKEAEDFLNRVYLTSVLYREDYFRKIEVSATGSLTITQHYIAYGIILFLLLNGIACANILQEKTTALENKLYFTGIGSVAYIVTKIISIAMLLWTSLVLLGGFLSSIIYFTTQNSVIENILCIFPLFIVSLAVASIIVLIFQLTKNLIGGVMLLFLSSIIMTFLSGGFLPAAFLPEGIRNVGQRMPTTILGKQVGEIIANTYTGVTFLQTTLIIIITSILSILVSKRRKR